MSTACLPAAVWVPVQVLTVLLMLQLPVSFHEKDAEDSPGALSSVRGVQDTGGIS